MSNVSQWSTAAANNNATPPDGWPEGQAPSTVNDAARENMAAVARWYEQLSADLTTGGVADAYTITTSDGHGALADIPLLVIIIHATNTGPSTLNVDALGVKNIVLPDGTALQAGELQANAVVALAYEPTNDAYVLIGGRKLGTAAAKDFGSSAGEVPEAENAGILARTGSWTRRQHFTTATLTDGANIAWDLDVAQVAKVTLGGNRTLDNPTNMQDGGFYSLKVIQDGTGGRTLAYGANYDFGSSGTPGLSTGAGQADILSFRSDGTKMDFLGIVRGFTG